MSAISGSFAAIFKSVSFPSTALEKISSKFSPSEQIALVFVIVIIIPLNSTPLPDYRLLSVENLTVQKIRTSVLI